MPVNKCIFFVALVGAVMGLEGCGKKGPLDPPEGSTYTYPQPYPPRNEALANEESD